MAVIDLKNATITMQDATPSTPLSVTLKLGEGTLQYTEKRNLEYKKDRGILDTVREGDQEPVDVKFDFNWVFLKGDADTTIEDAIKRRGGAAAWVSTDPDACAPYAVDIVIVYTPPCAAIKKETITLSDFRWEQLDHDPKAGTISCTGKCNITQATPVRSSQ